MIFEQCLAIGIAIVPVIAIRLFSKKKKDIRDPNIK